MPSSFRLDRTWSCGAAGWRTARIRSNDAGKEYVALCRVFEDAAARQAIWRTERELLETEMLKEVR